jgi:hypothetical protein
MAVLLGLVEFERELEGRHRPVRHLVVSIYANADDVASLREADSVIASLKISDKW